MKLTRPFRLAAALVVVFSMLFAQLAVAAYACPAMAPMAGKMDMTAMADMPEHNMEHCKGMDLKVPSLCQAHDQAGNQSLDKPATPQILPFAASGHAMTIESVVVSAVPAQSIAQSIILARTTAPPITIRNCCFRI